jgi:hypothetical protein
LLHDASEAYLVDLPRPLKELPEFAPYREAERRLQRAVAVRFGLPEDQPASVTEADDTMLWIDAHSLLGSMAVEVSRSTRPPFEITDPLPPVEAERLFLSRLPPTVIFRESHFTAMWTLELQTPPRRRASIADCVCENSVTAASRRRPGSERARPKLNAQLPRVRPSWSSGRRDHALIADRWAAVSSTI